MTTGPEKFVEGELSRGGNSEKKYRPKNERAKPLDK
jgi:hypothetical protein